MVEIFKSNFEEVFPQIKEAIENASFISIDTEFTGLEPHQDYQHSLFDSLEERYQKLKLRATNFVICQLGLSTFSKCKDENEYIVKTYIFYLRPHHCGSIDRRFLCQASSFDFLTQYNFDFNKFAKEGLPYLNEVEEAQIQKELLEGTLFNYHLRDHNDSNYEHLVLSQDSLLEEGKEATLEENKSIHVYIQLHELRQKYALLWASRRDDKIVLKKVSSDEKKELIRTTKKQEEDNFLEFYLGFTRVFRILAAAKKPLIGHNLLTDILLIYNSFFRPLPRTFKEFRQNFHELFPVVYDTKHVWLNVKRFYDVGKIPRASSLYELYTLLESPPDNLVTLFSPSVKSHSHSFKKEITFHEAGFDSFATGYVFIKICHILSLKRYKSVLQIIPQTWRQHLKAVEPFTNRINISWAKLHFIDLARANPSSHRPEYLHVKVKDINTPLNMHQLVEDLGRIGQVEVKKLNSREALVAVGNVYCSRDILEEFHDHKVLEITPYSTWNRLKLLRITLWFSCAAAGCVSFFLLRRTALK